MYDKLVEEMKECVNSNDYEVAHEKADQVLRKVALDNRLYTNQRKVIVSLYDEVDKHYA